MNDNPIAPPVYFSDPAPVSGSVSSTALGGQQQGEVFIGNNDFAGNIMDMDIMELVQILVVYAFIIAAALSAIFIFVGGVSFILSGGNDEKIKAAVNTIRYSIIGLIVTILSFTFVTIIGRMFGLDFMSYISYSDIQIRISQLVSSGRN